MTPARQGGWIDAARARAGGGCWLLGATLFGISPLSGGCGGHVTEDARATSHAGTGGIMPGSGGAMPGSGGVMPGSGGAPPASVIPDACRQDADCQLYGSCCRCEAVAVGQKIPPCPADCEVYDRCAEPHVEAARCVAGRCVLAASCDARRVSCFRAAPSCAAGSAPVVEGSCFRNDCLPLTECSDVSSCDVCVAAGLECVNQRVGRGEGSVHCVAPVPDCGAQPSCACMQVCSAPALCEADQPLRCLHAVE